MKFILALIIFCALFLNATSVFAESIPTPTLVPSVSFTNEFTVQNDSNSIITVLKGFVQGFDTFMGGFIFYTPNPLSDKILLQDKSEIPGLTKYRSIFYEIAVPILAIIIAFIAIQKIGSDNAQELKSFALRLLITVSLFIIVPPILSYSIDFNNLLVNKINSTQQFTTFLNTYLDKSQAQINDGADSEQFGIPHFNFSLVGGILKSLGEFVVKIFLFAITFLFLLGGFLYIGFQFVIRFATLLFLGVLFPLVIPFMLAEKTQHIVYTFFKSWFTVLIMQPAFVLGYAITTDIFTSILNSKGPSVGMLFFYTGFLFFLGGVNILVGRIFGSGWDAASVNMQGAISSRSIMQPAQSTFRDFKRSLLGGSIGSIAGQSTQRKFKESFISNGDGLSNSPSKHFTHSDSSSNNSPITGYSSKSIIPKFSEDLSKKGFQVDMVNQKQGVVSVSGEGFQYNDPKTGLNSIYPSRLEAIQDGISEEKLEHIQLDQAQFIDLSTFNKRNPNPHNFNAMQEAKKLGKDINFAYVKPYSHPERIQHFLEMSKSRNEALGVKGVIGQRQGHQTSDHIIRFYSDKPYEKRKNI